MKCNWLCVFANHNITRHEKENLKIDSKYYDSIYYDTVCRTELLQRVGNNLDKRQGGSDLRNLYKTATAQIQRFLAMKQKPTPSNTEKSVRREEPSYWKALNVVPTNERVGQTYITSTRQPLPKTKDS